ncbi:hypothetical protein AAXB25_22495 [Paenibacillus lautus]|uniref:hypothetical protein n=1 Tax=Paenibacillus lautus TaxID=1401 RepID=UPI003D287098
MHRIILVEYSVPSPVLTPSVQLGLGSTECRAGAWTVFLRDIVAPYGLWTVALLEETFPAFRDYVYLEFQRKWL